MSGISNQIFEEKMAIPEGGAPEEMDVSYHPDESPGYVSIKAKGPGRPINIRIGGKVQTLSQYIQANTCRSPISNEYVQSQLLPAQPKNEFEERSDDFLDKKTGDAVKFDSISPETVGSLDLLETSEPKEPDQNVERISAKLQESDKKSAQQDSGFSSQSEVVSIASKFSSDQPGILESPAKRKYRLSQEGSKKKVGSTKNSPGKDDRGLRLVQRQAPYPKWMNLPVREILKQGYYVDIEGKKHLLQVNLVPVENESETMLNRKHGADSESDPAVVNNIISEGSIDRPPDASLSLDQCCDPASAVYPVASTQPSTSTQYNEGNIFRKPGYQDAMTGIVSAPNIYGNAHDQPLDLTVAKPLDLSKKDKSTSNVLQGDNSVQAQPNEVVNSPVVTDMGDASMNVQGETNITDYRIRCPSTASAYESEVVDESYDTDLSANQSQNYCEQNSVSDGNLPSLGKLTLECNSKHNTSTQNSAVQDSAVEQEIANIVCRPEETLGGQQYIVDLVNSGQVSFQQLFSMYCQNQQRKSADIQQYTSSHSSIKHEADMIQQQQLQATVDIPQANNAEGEQDIQALAMPNLCSLELANTEGGILETEVERVRNKLKEKLRQKQNV